MRNIILVLAVLMVSAPLA